MMIDRMTLAEVDSIIQNVSYKEGWRLESTTRGDVILILWRFSAPDTNTGIEEEWTSRKWIISPFMTKSEVIQTAFLAAKTAELHEIHETFKYKGKVVFDPHLDIDTLIESNLPQDARNHMEKEAFGNGANITVTRDEVIITDQDFN